jgi:hypothetical protein
MPEQTRGTRELERFHASTNRENAIAPVQADFDIATVWRIEAEPEELTAIVLDPELLHLWCPTVFMYGELVERGRADGLGMTMRLHTKGFLPHSFFFVAEIVDLVPHVSMQLALSGDFEGVGSLSVARTGDGWLEARLRWRVVVKQPWIRRLVRLLPWVFTANHKWAVGNARRLIQAEVYRRRRRANTFTPARATFPHNLAFVRAWQRRQSARRGWAKAAK